MTGGFDGRVVGMPRASYGGIQAFAHHILTKLLPGVVLGGG